MICSPKFSRASILNPSSTQNHGGFTTCLKRKEYATAYHTSSTQETGIIGQFSQRAREILSTEGIAGLTKRIVGRLQRKPLLVNAYVLAVNLKDMAKLPPPVDLEIREITGKDEHDIEAVAQFRFYGESPADILHFLADGQRCYVAKHKGQVVACYWRMSGGFYFRSFRRRFELADDEEFQFGAFTLAEFRGKGILPYLKTQSAPAQAQNHSGSRAFIIIEVNHKDSLRSAYKQGFSRVGRIGFAEVLGIRFHYLWGRNAFPKTTRRCFLERN